VIQVIEENNGVEKLTSIINSQILERYRKPQAVSQSPLIEKAIVYLKYQSNYEVFEEAYRNFLTKRMCTNSNVPFAIEEEVASKITHIMGSEAIALSLTILKDLQISRSISDKSNSILNLNTFSYIALPNSFSKDELDLNVLKRIENTLKIDLASKYNQISTSLLSTEAFQKRKLSLTYHGSLDLYSPKRNIQITLTFVQGLIFLLLLQTSNLQQTLDNLK